MRPPRVVLALLAAALLAAPATAVASPSGGAAAPSPGGSTQASGGVTPSRTKAAKPKHRRRTFVFPIAGVHSFGGADARFGARRSGHTHQGQDVMAAEGTPLVAPHAATVRFVSYQAGGAGYYVVLHDSGGRYEFALMHLQKGSTAVREGQSVRAGQRIGRVGHTGDAFGPHLHFEVWVGPWQTGGDPLHPPALPESLGARLPAFNAPSAAFGKIP